MDPLDRLGFLGEVVFDRRSVVGVSRLLFSLLAVLDVVFLFLALDNGVASLLVVVVVDGTLLLLSTDKTGLLLLFCDSLFFRSPDEGGQFLRVAGSAPI
jgi:hypothetical protein